MTKQLRLLKDIVIPAGTIFFDCSFIHADYGDHAFSTLLGLSNDSSGELIYNVDSDHLLKEQLSDWFETIP